MSTPGRHPHFNDRGAVNWYSTLADALVVARAEKKKVFIDYGREACGNCRELVEGVIPGPEVKKVLTDSFVSVAIDCDRPDPAVRALGAANMAGARTLPFILFTDENGKFLHGTSGGASTASFLADLERMKKL